jgi:hypothetical protein
MVSVSTRVCSVKLPLRIQSMLGCLQIPGLDLWINTVLKIFLFKQDFAIFAMIRTGTSTRFFINNMSKCTLLI